MTIPLSSISIAGRARTDLGDVSGIQDSIAALGSINPIVVSKKADGTYDLVAGRRRLQCALNLKYTEAHHAAILEPGKIAFLFKDEIPDDVLKQAELDENLWRLAPKWQENCILVADVHRLKKEKSGEDWGQKQTAELLGRGYKKSSVSNSLILAEYLRANDEEVRNCATMTDALSILSHRRELEGLAELHRRAQAGRGTTSVESFLDVINITTTKKPPLPTPQKTVEISGPLEQPTGPVIVPLTSMFQCCDFRELYKHMPDACFDHIVTDIPYGIDMDNLDTMKNIESVRAEHDVEENIALMRPFLEGSYRLVKPGGFCIFFYDLDHHEKLQQWAAEAGWKVQRWPLIAHKTSPCKNSVPQFNFTKNYEVAMVLRHDESSILRKPQTGSIWTGDFSIERKLYNNPFAKPFNLWKWVYDSIAFVGQTVFDPFCGEMSACRAAVNCGLQPRGCEINEKHFLRGLELMKSVYAVIHQTNVAFT